MTNLWQAAAQPSVDDPHTLGFGIAAVLCLLVPAVIVGTKRDLSWQRKVYWASTLGSVVCVVIASLPNFATGLALGFLAVFLMVLRAYFATQYIKIGARVIAFDTPVAASSRRGSSGGSAVDQPYSPTVSAAKLWWLMAVGVGVIGAGNMWGYVIDREGLRYGALGLGIVVLSAALYGVVDAVRLQRIARGQFVPFVILSVVSAGIFAVCYLGSYATTRWLKS